MTVCKLHIVGLPHLEVKECLDRFLAEAQGRTMTLCPEPENMVDPKAICAFDWQGRRIGYVAARELPLAWQMLNGSQRNSLRGHVTDVNTEHKSLVFECNLQLVADAVADSALLPTFPEWKYSGPLMKLTLEMTKLDYMMTEINERLDERDAWTDAEREDFIQLARNFCELSEYDISREMWNFRQQLCQRIEATADAGLMPITDELQLAYSRSGREAANGRIFRYWTKVLTNPSWNQCWQELRSVFDYRKLHDELDLFPGKMYSEWQECPDTFFAKLLYRHIPREALRQLFSGIAFCQAAEDRQEVQETDGQNPLPESPICLNPSRGQKIDIIRVLNVMYEQGRFQSKTGSRLTKKELFQTFGQFLNIDLSDYDKHLSRTFSDCTSLEKQLQVFDDMKQKMAEIWDNKLKNEKK